eukprot:gene3881-4239_t
MNGILSLSAIVSRHTWSSYFTAHCDGKKSNEGSRPKEMVAVYLKPDSKAVLETALAKRNIKNATVRYVCINTAASKSDLYVYQPLFGNRTAFRLKELITLEDGSVVGTGRVSNMIGEIKDAELEVSLPIFKGENSSLDEDKLQMLHDLPSRIARVPGIHSRPFWKGRLTAGKVGDRSYGAQSNVQLVRIPFDQQVVVDGFLCSNLCMNEQGNCEFEPTEDFSEPAQSPNRNDNSGKNLAPSTPHVTDDASTEKEAAAMSAEHHSNEAEDAKNECPVCKYIKGGPCREEFLAWDHCLKSLTDDEELQKCFNVTRDMMSCMKKYEYYDIMIAGTDYERIEKAADNKETAH